MKTAMLIRLYPRAWQQRYGAEMRAMLADEPFTLRGAADLLAGAVDARLSPQQLPGFSGSTQGVTTMTRVLRCSPAGISARDQRRSAAWMIGASLVLVTISTVVQLRVGPNAFSEGLLYGAFPAALMLSNECTTLKRYSPQARMVLAGGGALFIILLTWAAAAVGRAI